LAQVDHQAVITDGRTGDAVRAPAVQETLDLFNGKVVDVRETKPAKEGP